MASGTNDSYKVIVAVVFSTFLSITCIALRLASRRIKSVPLLADDYFALSGLVFATAIAVISLLLVGAGLGEHLSQVDADKLTTYHSLSYAVSLIYPPAVTFPKLSILFLYRRILPVKQILFSTIIMIILLGIWCTALFITTILQCYPIRKAWNPAFNGHCINHEDYVLSLQIPSIIIDAIIFLLPLKVVWDCALKLPQKLTASSFFIAGILPLIGDVAKLVVTIRTQSLAASQVDNLVWTNLEPAFAMLAACLPVLRPVIQCSTKFHSQRVSRANTPTLEISAGYGPSYTPQKPQTRSIPFNCSVLPTIPEEAHIKPEKMVADLRTHSPEAYEATSNSGSFLEL